MNVALEMQSCCWERSGIGTFTYELAKRLEPEARMSFCGNLFNFLGRRDNSEALKGINFPIRISKALPYGIYRRIWNKIPLKYNCFFPEADLNIFFNFIVPPRISGKVMTFVHDMIYIRCPETMTVSNFNHLKAGMPYSIARCDKIMTVSEFSKREIMDLLDVPAEKIRIVNPAAAISGDTLSDEVVRRKNGIRGKYILFVGTIEPRKNITRLLQAFELLKERYALPHQLVLAGGEGWRNEDTYETLSALKHKSDVIRTGFVSGAEKNSLYKNADVFVFPSIYEGFGIPPLEAMHWGCPVVASDAASLPEVVGDAADLVDPYEQESIAEGIFRVLSNQEYAKRLRERGYERAKAFTWEKSVGQLMKACNEVLYG